MGLVDYSDSETSDNEQSQVTNALAPAPTKAKSTFTKVFDRSNSGKIKVSLPHTILKDERDCSDGDEPRVKRLRMQGSGVFSGFNSLLPPPKRTVQVINAAIENGKSASVHVGAKINFKTGAAPAFTRDGDLSKINGEHSPADTLSATATEDIITSKPDEEVRLVGKPTMFKPLSVTRKPAKKKVSPANELGELRSSPLPAQLKEVPPRPKFSLFSFSTDIDDLAQPSTSTSQEYEPLIYSNQHADGADKALQNLGSSNQEVSVLTNPQHSRTVATPTPPVAQSLSDIAGDLNLTEAERRRLFGRTKNSSSSQQSATKIINFNTDQEYLHNEELRASGETVTHNPVRAIAPGKHSLKQLVNAAQNQREALEESFAKGKSNRAEASSRYGW